MKLSLKIISLFMAIVMVTGVVVVNAVEDPVEGPADYVANCQKGRIDVVVNVYDWDEAVNNDVKVPMANVAVAMGRLSRNGRYADTKMATAVSDENGVARIVLNVQTLPDGNVYLNGVYSPAHVVFDTLFRYADTIRYDLAPISSGYCLNTSVPGYIRNLIKSAYGGGCPCGSTIECTHQSPCPYTSEPSLGYNDFVFHGNMPEHGAYIEFDMYVQAYNVTVTYENDHIKDFDEADFPSETIRAGGCFTEPSGTFEHDADPELQFAGWKNKATRQPYDFSKPASESVTLVPMWINPNVAGYIHLDSFLWDHDAFNGTYGTGRTSTTVNDLTYIIQYYDQATAGTTVWNTLCKVTVDENGQADVAITAEMLAELGAFRDSITNLTSVNGQPHRVAIDIGPDPESQGWHTPDRKPNKYAWDWIQYDTVYEHGAGVTGVRTMQVNADGAGQYNLIRDDNSWVQAKNGDVTSPVVNGNVQYGTNVNHVMWLTDDMLENGFEIWWTTYVSSSMTVQFDLNGGSGAGDYSDQILDPVNSLPANVQFADYTLDRPANDPVRGEDEVFIGWFKVIGQDQDNNDLLESTPWDFAGRKVTKSMTLKAMYAAKTFRVVFDPANGENAQSRDYVTGESPVWTGADPVKESDGEYVYEFEKWVETVGAGTGADYFFKAAYDPASPARVIWDDASAVSPVTVAKGFADVTVYTAQYKATPVSALVNVTVHANGETFVVSAEPGDFRELVSAPAVEGYRLFGWYADEAFTTPADLSDVTEDIDVYVKYIEETYFTLKIMNTVSKKVITKTRVITVIDDRDNYAEYGFEITVNGVKTVYPITKDYASVNGYSPVTLYGSRVDKRSRLIYQDVSLKDQADGTTISVVTYYVKPDGEKVYVDEMNLVYRVDHMETLV